MITHSQKLLALSALMLLSGGNIFAAASDAAEVVYCGDENCSNSVSAIEQLKQQKKHAEIEKLLAQAETERANADLLTAQANTERAKTNPSSSKGEKGDKGEPGAKGEPGDKGEPGANGQNSIVPGPAGIGFNKLQQFIIWDKANPKKGAAAMTGAAVIAYAALYAGEANDTIQKFAANGAKATLANDVVQTAFATSNWALSKNVKVQGTLVVPAHVALNYAAQTAFTKTTESWANSALEFFYVKDKAIVKYIASWIYAEDTYKSQAAKETVKAALAAAIAYKVKA